MLLVGSICTAIIVGLPIGLVSLFFYGKFLYFLLSVVFPPVDNNPLAFGGAFFGAFATAFGIIATITIVCGGLGEG